MIDFAHKQEARILVLTSRSPLAYHGYGFDNGEGGLERKNGGNDYISNTTANSGQSDLDRRVRVLAGIEEQLRALTAEFDVIVIGPIPEAGWNVPAMLARRALRGSNGVLSTSYEAYLARTEELRKTFNAAANVRLHQLPMSEVVCDLQIQERCVNELNSTSLYSDDDHFSNAGARLLAPKLANWVEHILEN